MRLGQHDNNNSSSSSRYHSNIENRKSAIDKSNNATFSVDGRKSPPLYRIARDRSGEIQYPMTEGIPPAPPPSYPTLPLPLQPIDSVITRKWKANKLACFTSYWDRVMGKGMGNTVGEGCVGSWQRSLRISSQTRDTDH